MFHGVDVVFLVDIDSVGHVPYDDDQRRSRLNRRPSWQTLWECGGQLAATTRGDFENGCTGD